MARSQLITPPISRESEVHLQETIARFGLSGSAIHTRSHFSLSPDECLLMMSDRTPGKKSTTVSPGRIMAGRSARELAFHQTQTFAILCFNMDTAEARQPGVRSPAGPSITLRR